MSGSTYRGYKIVPSAVRLAENNKWDCRVTIGKLAGDETVNAKEEFSTGWNNTYFDSEWAAIAAGMELGRNLIEGTVPGLKLSI